MGLWCCQHLAHCSQGCDPKKDDDHQRREVSVPSGAQHLKIVVFCDQPNAGQRAIDRLWSGMLIKTKRVELSGHG